MNTSAPVDYIVCECLACERHRGKCQDAATFVVADVYLCFHCTPTRERIHDNYMGDGFYNGSGDCCHD